jgi:hypothetical protein
MGKLQKLQCEQCAGKIDGVTLTCQSCGMQYRLNEDFTLGRIEVSNLKFITIGGSVAVPAYVLNTLGTEAFSEMTLKKMAEDMALKILPFMEFQSMFDPKYNEIQTYTRVRVAEPVVKSYGAAQYVRDVIDHYGGSFHL